MDLANWKHNLKFSSEGCCQSIPTRACVASYMKSFYCAATQEWTYLKPSGSVNELTSQLFLLRSEHSHFPASRTLNFDLSPLVQRRTRCRVKQLRRHLKAKSTLCRKKSQSIVPWGKVSIHPHVCILAHFVRDVL